MGLLANAIRDHLELKRRHGADPREVAHLEHEALGPVSEDDGLHGAGLYTDEAYGEGMHDDGLVAETGAMPELDSYASFADEDADLRGQSGEGGSETMEIDMRSVIGVGHVAPAGHAAPRLATHDGAAEPGWHSLGSPDMGDPAADLGWEIPHRSRRAS